MKKSLIALAVLAASSAAFAQSSVTLFGALDAGLSRYSQNGFKRTMMTTSGNTSSALGFRGVEDMGGGMYAGFWLETAVINDTGNAGLGSFFSRRSYLSLAGPFGQLRLGRDYTPSFWNHTVFDPFGTLGAGAGSNVSQGGGTNNSGGDNPVTAARTNNGFSYLWGFSPNASSHIGTGLYVFATYAPAENVSGTWAANRYLGARVGYAAGPINVAIAASRSNSAGTTPATQFKYKNWNIGGSYDFGMAKAMAKYGVNNSDLAGTKHTWWSLGATIPVGAGYIPVSFGQIKVDNAAGSKGRQFAVGYVHNLSKRTALYGTYSHITNKNGGNFTFQGGNGSSAGFAGTAAAAGNGNGFDLGVKHSF